MFRQVAWVAVLLGCVSVAVGEVHNWIYQHNEYYNNPQNPGYPFYEVDQENRAIIVYRGVPNEDFMFEAVVEDEYHQYIGPGDINAVADWGYDTEVHIRFVGHNGHPYGAANIKLIYLSHEDTYAVIDELNISGHLGEDSYVEADAAGTWTVGGNVVHDVRIPGPITGPMTIEGDLCTHQSGAKLVCGSLAGLTVGGDVVGDVNVTGDITGPVTIVGDVLADIDAGGAIVGPLLLCRNLRANLACGSLGDAVILGSGQWSGTSSISIRGPYDGNMTVYQLDLYRLEISGELSGAVDMPYVTVRQVDTGPIGSGGQLHLLHVGPATPEPIDHCRIGGDVYGALELDHIFCPVTVSGAVHGYGVRIGTCYGEALLGGGIAERARLDVGMIRGGGLLRIEGGVAEGGGVTVGAIGFWNEVDQARLEIDGNMAGHLSVEQLNRDLQLDSVPESGVVTIEEFSGYSTDPFRASLVVKNGMAGQLAVGGERANAPPDGADVKFVKIEIGTVQPQGVTGELYFFGSLVQGVDVTIHGNLQNQDPEMRGGHIIILGGFGTQQGEATITIDGAMTGPRPFIAVDYDGWDSAHRWQAGGTVTITKPDPNNPNAPPLTLRGNTPAWHVWEITECRGDMNNDGKVNFDDINPFVLALTSVSGYSLDFPGLGALEGPLWDPEAGSRVYHGDCTCNGLFDAGDINPFILRLYQGCCWEQCGDCPPPGGNGMLGGPPEPELLAAKLAVNVKPELFDDLVAMAAAAAKVQTDPKLKLYWEKVHHALAP